MKTKLFFAALFAALVLTSMQVEAQEYIPPSISNVSWENHDGAYLLKESFTANHIDIIRKGLRFKH